MPPVEEVRATISNALENRPKPLGAVEVIAEMKKAGFRAYDRTYLRDFMKDKKRSLDQDFREDLAEFLGIDEELLRIAKHRYNIDTIRKGAKAHYYVTEHMKARGWDDKDLADRMDVTADIIRKWRHATSLQDWQGMAFANAFGFDDLTVLTRPPTISAKPKRVLKQSRKRA